MKSIEDALVIRRRVFGAFEMAEIGDQTREERRHWLTFALVGAGPTGVELAGQIRGARHQDTALRVPEHPAGGRAGAAVRRRQRTPGHVRPELSAKAASSLDKLGVEQHMHSIVTRIDGTGLSVRAEDGTETRYDVGTVLWTAGVAAPSVATAVAQATGANRTGPGASRSAPT